MIDCHAGMGVTPGLTLHQRITDPLHWAMDPEVAMPRFRTATRVPFFVYEALTRIEYALLVKQLLKHGGETMKRVGVTFCMDPTVKGETALLMIP